jgi:hypothetical protein
VPVTYGSQRGSSERTYQIAMDWTRRIMQLAAVATILLYAYLMYGLFMGDVGHWASLSHDERVRIATNVEGAVLYLNIALGILLLTVCILYYDEEIVGYMLIAGAVALYYGLPFIFDFLFGSQIQEWEKPGSVNRAALAIFSQFKVLALMMAVPGGILALRDLVLRVVDGSARNKEEFDAMQYGGAVKEEEQVGTPLIGVFAKCWQLPYCRAPIRKGCPIYHARTKCWKERVGCMCEENVIRNSMDALIGKEIIQREDPLIDRGGPQTLATMKPIADAGDKTEEFPPKKVEAAPPPRRNVKIPHNPNLSMRVKMERCRNCVIYNEHQRMKYQMFAPLTVLALPALAIWKIDAIIGGLNSILSAADNVMSRLSLAQGGAGGAATNLFAGAGAVQYIVIGCLVVIVTTMSLRSLEYIIFRMKI